MSAEPKLKVVGAGFGRTGTLSLKLALERFGFGKCDHMLARIFHEGHPGPRPSGAGRACPLSCGHVHQFAE